MAGLAHLGVGFAAKKVLPNINIGYLLLASMFIDICFMFFSLFGLERMPKPGGVAIPYWSHSLLMSLLWSALFGLTAWLLTKNKKTALLLALLVFSHWILDFISHPMTAVFPNAIGLPLFFSAHPLVGLGLWSSKINVFIGEGVCIIGGLAVYVHTLIALRRQKNGKA